jgi:hypothetical protein
VAGRRRLPVQPATTPDKSIQLRSRPSRGEVCSEPG